MSSENTLDDHYRSNIALPSQNTFPDNFIAKVNELGLGEIISLEHPDVLEGIASTLFNRYQAGAMRDTLLLLEQLGQATHSPVRKHRERALIVISMVADKILEEDNEGLVEAISHLLVGWLKNETEYLAGFEYVCMQLGKLIQKMLEHNLWYQAENLLVLLQDIKKGLIKKNKPLKQIIRRAQNTVGHSETLEKLTSCYLDSENARSDIAGELLIQLGSISTPHLLQTLSLCQSKKQRFRILNLIPSVGNDAIPPLVNGLQDQTPWYVKRNILFILSQISDPVLYDIIVPFLQHQDIRVQQEAVNCINAMNDNKKAERLLEALDLCDDQLKPTIIRMLGPLHDQRIGSFFVDLLKNISSYDAEQQNSIIQVICSFLPTHSPEQTFAILENIVADKKTRHHLTEETLKIIEKSCSILNKTQGSDILPEWVVAIDPQEKKVSKSVNQVEDVSVDYQKEDGQSSTPDWYLDVFNDESLSLAFMKHLHAWKDFYGLFSHEEFIVFQALLSSKRFSRGDHLVTHGDIDSTLFFIEQGQISVHFPTEENENSTHLLEKGALFGHEVFMNGSEWPATLKATRDTVAFLFDQEKLLSLQPSYPELCTKILRYCKARDTCLVIPLKENAN